MFVELWPTQSHNTKELKTKKQDRTIKESELKTNRHNRLIQKSELKTKKQDRTIKESELKTNRHNRPIQKSELDINRKIDQSDLSPTSGFDALDGAYGELVV
jgi:hypothetical protein